MTPGVATPMADLSLRQLLDPHVLADLYPLYQRLRSEDPVHWDPYLHAWVVTRHADVAEVLGHFSANRTPSPERLASLGMHRLIPIAEVLGQQMLFVDPPKHTRPRVLFGAAFSARRVERLRAGIATVVEQLLDQLSGRTKFDVIDDFATPLPAIVIADILGVPRTDYQRLKEWSETFAEILGNFQHNPGRVHKLLDSLADMIAYFREAGRAQAKSGGDGLVGALAASKVDEDSLTEDEVAANLVSLMVGGMETTTNLIGNGLLTLLRYPEQMRWLREDISRIVPAVEELLRFESPSQFSARTAFEDMEFGGKQLKRGQAVIAVLGAANRDPAVFAEPDRFDPARADNHHLAFGRAAHYCPGAGLTRIEGQLAFEALLNRYPVIRQISETLVWRPNLGLRGLSELHVSVGA